MKVKLMKDYRKYYTLEELDQAKAVIASEKEDTETAASWAEYAVNMALKDKYTSCVEILKAEASTAKNCRVWDQYGEGTGYMDVWIEAVAETTGGFIKVGAYLSDIWQTGSIDYRDQMFIRIYKEA